MSNFNQDKERKGGFWSALSGLFGGSGASGAGAAGGLFATKAGIVGMVLGGATIAAGVGVVYNFVGSSSKPVYSPELFQNSYYEEESAAASQQRAQERDRSAASASTLDLFSEQAKKEGISGGMGSEAGEQKASEAKDGEQATASASAEAPSADGAPAAPGAAGAAGGGAKLAPAAGFSGGSRLSGGGSSGTSIPRMQNQGGMSGGIGGQFANMYRPPAGANDGRINGLTASRSSAKSSPKYAVPNFKKSGAYGQAKVTNAKSRSAAYSADASGARSTAEAAFSGETGNSGDVGGMAGAGMGGAGISQGSSLKASDPNLNSSEYTPPTPNQNTPTDESPWNDLLMSAMWWGLGSIGGILMAKIFGKIAKGGGAFAAAAYAIAVGFAYAAMAAAAVVIGYGVALMMGHKSDPPDPKKDFEGQTMYGLGIIFVGLKLMMAAMDALAGCEKPDRPDNFDKSKVQETTVDGKGTGKFTYGANGPSCNSNGYLLDDKGGFTKMENPAGGWASGVTSGINEIFKGL